MTLTRLSFRLGLLALLATPLTGCLAAAAVGTVAGVAVGVTGAAVGVTAKGVGMAAGAVIPDGDDDEEDERRR